MQIHINQRSYVVGPAVVGGVTDSFVVRNYCRLPVTTLCGWHPVITHQSISHDHKFGILFDVLKGFFISFSDFWCHFVQFLSVLNDVQA